ncbi:MAG TPA: exonuclease SbcCD subunit D [Anaerolineae bacterium]|nr:exonuclease SbcCD subunit D [Anaerolineae bacterium]
MSKINVLHFADIHIGMENYGHIDSSTGINSRVIDFLRRFDEVIDYGLSHDVDLVIFAGDAFKTRDPSPTLQREFARRVKRFVDANVPVVMLVGNHDLPAMEKKASSIDIYRTLGVPNVIIGWEEALHTIDTKRGKVQVATAPYPMRNRLLAQAEHRGKSIEELDKSLQDIVGDNTRALAEQLDPTLPSILTGHFTVSGATYGSERSVMIGRDVAVLKSVLADGPWDYVALGHIHKHQNLNEGRYPAMVYPGSLERIDFGEEKEAKGFCWVELEKGNTLWQFVEVHSRPFVTINLDVREEDDPTMAAQAALAQYDLAEAIVRVNVRMRPEQDASLREKDLRAALRSADYIAAINRQADREVRERLGGLSPEGMTPKQLLEKYLFAKNVDDDRIDLLIKHAEKIFEMTNE